MLVNLKTILSGTREGGYAVGLFNCVTLEMTRGIIAAAEELRSPVLSGPGESLLPGASLPDYADMMLGIARRASVPVAVHFDHGFTPELVEEAISLGFTSVMYDCSRLLAGGRDRPCGLQRLCGGGYCPQRLHPAGGRLALCPGKRLRRAGRRHRHSPRRVRQGAETGP